MALGWSPQGLYEETSLNGLVMWCSFVGAQDGQPSMRMRKTHAAVAVLFSMLAISPCFLSKAQAQEPPLRPDPAPPAPAPVPVEAQRQRLLELDYRPAGPGETPTSGNAGVPVSSQGGSKVKVEATAPQGEKPQEEALLEATLPVRVWGQRRRPWIGTLTVAGASLASSVVLGGLALSRSRDFRAGQEAGIPTEELAGIAGQAKQMAFATDLLIGTTALFSLATLVLRFGVVGNTPQKIPNLEPAFEIPGREVK